MCVTLTSVCVRERERYKYCVRDTECVCARMYSVCLRHSIHFVMCVCERVCMMLTSVCERVSLRERERTFEGVGVYLSRQLQTLVAIVISVVHLVLPLCQYDTAHHHRQVHTLGSEVKLLHLQEHSTLVTPPC